MNSSLLLVAILLVSNSALAQDPVAPAAPAALPVGSAAALKTITPERTVNRSDVPFQPGATTVGEVSDITTKKPLGLGLDGIKEDSTMAKLGFKNGDVLVSVNGHAMLMVSDMELISKSLKVSKFHDYVVRRGGDELKWKVTFVDGQSAAAATPKPVPLADAEPERTIKLTKAKLKGVPVELDKILQGAKMVPEMDKKGEVRCFRAVNIGPKSIVKMAGVQPGDCLLAVNDRNLDSPVALLGVYERILATGGPVTYVIERKGETRKFRVEVE